MVTFELVFEVEGRICVGVGRYGLGLFGSCGYFIGFKRGVLID